MAVVQRFPKRLLLRQLLRASRKSEGAILNHHQDISSPSSIAPVSQICKIIWHTEGHLNPWQAWGYRWCWGAEWAFEDAGFGVESAEEAYGGSAQHGGRPPLLQPPCRSHILPHLHRRPPSKIPPLRRCQFNAPPLVGRQWFRRQGQGGFRGTV